MCDKMDGTVTYQLEKTNKYEGVDVVKEEDNPEKGFIRCTHKPSNGYASTKACVKYNSKILMGKDNSTIQEFEEQTFSMIIVYLCENITNEKLDEGKDNKENCIPLLVELNKNGADGSEYYIHKHDHKSDKGSEWVKLSDWLNYVLPQLGLGTNSKQYGFYILRALLEKVGVNIENGKRELTEKISEIQPEKLKKLLEQEVDDSERKKSLLILVLIRIKFELSNSIIIFLERKTNQNYTDSKIKKLLKTKDESTIFNKITTVSLNDKKPNEEKNKEDKEEDEEEEDDDDDEEEEGNDDLHSMQLKYYTHNITIKDNEQTIKKQNNTEIVFFIFHIKIEIYNEDGTQIDCLYYDGDEKVFVFFYDNDPRPLLVVYKDKAYRPKSLSSYYTKWVCVEIEKLDNVNIKNNAKLRDILSEVLYYLNPVKLEINSHRHHASAKYINQTFYKHEKTISIETEIFGEDMNCYKEYVHQAGSTGHVLGEIIHNESKLFESFHEYKNTALSKRGYRFPDNVTAYYYMFDNKHLYPLMIELHYVFFFDDDGFKNSTEDFYKLVSVSDRSLKWAKIGNDSGKGGQQESDKNFLDNVERLNKENLEFINELSDSEDIDHSEESPKYRELTSVIEEKLKEIRQGLHIVYEKEPKNLILAAANNCREETNVLPIVGAISSLGLIGIAAGLTYYKYSHNFISLYRQLF